MLTAKQGKTNRRCSRPSKGRRRRTGGLPGTRNKNSPWGFGGPKTPKAKQSTVPQRNSQNQFLPAEQKEHPKTLCPILHEWSPFIKEILGLFAQNPPKVIEFGAKSNRNDAPIFRPVLRRSPSSATSTCSAGIPTSPPTGAFAPYGPYWRHARKICILELLSAKRVESYRPARAEEVDQLVGRIAADASSIPGGAVNLSRLLGLYANGVLCRAVLGREFAEGGEYDRHGFHKMLDEYQVLLGGSAWETSTRRWSG